MEELLGSKIVKLYPGTQDYLLLALIDPYGWCDVMEGNMKECALFSQGIDEWWDGDAIWN